MKKVCITLDSPYMIDMNLTAAAINISLFYRVAIFYACPGTGSNQCKVRIHPGIIKMHERFSQVLLEFV